MTRLRTMIKKYIWAEKKTKGIMYVAGDLASVNSN